MHQLSELYKSTFSAEPSACVQLTGSASNRKYYRLSGEAGPCIGVVGVDALENKAFLTIARHFHGKGINVPRIIAVSEDESAYLQEDLGDVILFDLLTAARKSGDGMNEVDDLLCRTMAMLPKIQCEGASGLDFSVCYPQPSFDRRMVMFDLNYFKYCFLKPSGLEFNEVLLQDDFERFADDLLEEDTDTFLYRDFNARNVMVKDGEPYFIDFQGGRRGPIYYDVASFAWQARARFTQEQKESMLKSYLDALSGYMPVDVPRFRSTLRLFVLFRLLQVLGAYGFRGWVEHKANFVTSIPAAIAELKVLAAEGFADYPYLTEVLGQLAALPRFEPEAPHEGELEVTVFSFSFKKGVPHDPSGNGGGYVFDCRSIHNPGRYEPYKKLTGRDEPVIKFLEDDGEVFGFLEHVYGVVDPHVETYSRRGFTNLMVSFGCTGGQHRSVYCAEHLAAHLAEKYPSIRVRLIHREQGIDLKQKATFR
jgi:aminoglycoside/choline kinase family phosphotransferase